MLGPNIKGAKPSFKIPAIPYFPTRGWKIKRPEQVGMDPAKLEALSQFAFDPQAKYKTDSLVVIKDGYLVLNQYANGYGPNQPHMLWSFSKGFVNGILGVAVNKGLLHLETPVHSYYPKLNRDHARDITLRHLMNMSSGLEYYEEHPSTIILSDSIFLNYSAKAYKDMAAYVAEKPVKHAAGQQFNYSSGECNLAMGVLKQTIGDQRTYDEFPFRELFDKLGMRSLALEQDFAGTFVGGSFGWSSALDIAKFGLLYLNDGVWEGKRLFPEGWVDFSLTIAPALLREGLQQKKEMRLNQEAYGAYWWLNKKLPMNKNVPYPGTPEDAFLAMGYKGQTLAVIPSLGLIVVRLGNDGLEPESKMSRVKFLKLLVDSVGGGQ